MAEIRGEMEPFVSIIIVNYNSGDMLRNCLISIVSQDYPNIEVIVIDNASSDNSFSSLNTEKRPPNLKLIRNPLNSGFAGAQNQGIGMATGKYVMPLNFDIRLTSGCIRNMVNAMESDARVGSVTCKLLYMDDQGLTSKLYATGHRLPANRFPLLRGANQADNGQYDTSEPVFGAPGAAVLYRPDMVKDIAYRGQFFDEKYFMWYEDVDVDWRAQLRGWKCLYCAEALAYHKGHPSGYKGTFRKFHARLSIRNRWLMIATNECPRCFLSNLGSLISYEFDLLLYVIRTGLLLPYLQAIIAFFVAAPYLLHKRKHVMVNAKRQCLDKRFDAL